MRKHQVKALQGPLHHQLSQVSAPAFPLYPVGKQGPQVPPALLDNQVRQQSIGAKQLAKRRHLFIRWS